MNGADVALICASVAMAVLALALAVGVYRTTRVINLERGVTYRFTIPEDARVPMAPGEWTFRPGKDEVEWKGTVGRISREVGQ